MSPKHAADHPGLEDDVDAPPYYAVRREHTEQGLLHDGGVIAALGAVADHRPESVVNALTRNDDGTYTVLLHETTKSAQSGISEPTGRIITVTVSTEVPFMSDEPTIPAFAQMKHASWVALFEKAIALVDTIWSPDERADWEARWTAIRKTRDAQLLATGQPPLPDSHAPSGYLRLDQVGNAYDRADLLSMLTGERAEVREMPDGPNAEEILLTDFETQLAARKPLLTLSRAVDNTGGEYRLPHRLYPLHVYEVTAVDDDRIRLRNPWNRFHPAPLRAAEFLEFFRLRLSNGSRYGVYSTLC